MNPYRAKLFLVIAAILVCSQAAFTQVLQTGMGNVLYCDEVNGDFVTVGASTRTASYQGAQTPTFDLSVNSIPANATVVKAIANWSYLGNAAPAINNIQIDGQAVQGNLSGEGQRDLVWGFEKAFAYTADITNIVNGNDVYRVTGATDNLGASRIGEGLSIVLVYSLAGAPLREVSIYDGYTSTTTADGSAELNFCNEYTGGDLHFFANALDGQVEFQDNFQVNGMDVNGALGTEPAPNAFMGNLGPGFPGENFYDHAEGDASTFVAANSFSMTYRTLGFDDINQSDLDAIGHSFAAVSFQVVPEPSTIALLACGLASLTRRSWRSRK